MTIADKFNNLNGKIVTIQHLLQIRKEAVETCSINTLDKIDVVLSKAKTNKFKLNITTPVIESLLGIEKLPANSYTQSDSIPSLEGNKSVYKEITDMVIKAIEKHGDKLIFEEDWNRSSIKGRLLSGSSKKPYSGINAFILEFLYPKLYEKKWKNRFFFTKKHTEKIGGKLKKGAIPYKVVFYSVAYRYVDKQSGINIFSPSEKTFTSLVYKNLQKINWIQEKLKTKSDNRSLKDVVETFVNYHSFPIIKSYFVYNGEDITGIDWEKYGSKNDFIIDETLDFKPIEIAEKIVDLYPNKPKIVSSGDQAFYSPAYDIVNMPDKAAFKTETGYYATLFHELIHSTGHKTRLNRSMKGRKGDLDYAFEELIAEIGAAFISGETGILNHHIMNTAAYVKGWNKRLISNLKSDSQFIFKASAKAQKAADYILDVDAKGIPAYRKELEPESKEKTKLTKKEEQLALFGINKINKKFNNLKDFYKYAFEWCKSNLIGKKYFHPELKKEVLFTRKGIEHSMKSNISYIRIAMIFDAYELLKKSKLLSFEPDKKNRKEITGIYRMICEHKINNDIYDVRIVLREGRNGVIYYDHHSVKRKGVNTATPVSSKGIVTNKNSLHKNNTKTNPKQGLSGINDDLFEIASDFDSSKKAPNTFRLKGEIGKFLQDLQRYRMAIVLTGDPHAGKSEFAKQLINAFLDNEMTAAIWDLEQGGLISKDTKDSIDRNISEENQKRIAVAGEAPKGFESIKDYADKFDVVMIDSFQKLNIPASKFDELRLQHPNTIWIVIFQQNSEGGTRGGVTADYDTPIKIKVHKVDSSFVNNYAELQKNRGNTVGLKYNIAQKKLLPEEIEPTNS